MTRSIDEMISTKVSVSTGIIGLILVWTRLVYTNAPDIILYAGLALIMAATGVEKYRRRGEE